MGYTHYWRRIPEFDAQRFKAVRQDFDKIVLALADAGVQLGDGYVIRRNKEGL